MQATASPDRHTLGVLGTYRLRTIEVPEEIAANADEVEQLAGRVSAELTSRVAGDPEAAEEFARAAVRVARRLAELNA
jgi:tellurite resistance protein